MSARDKGSERRRLLACVHVAKKQLALVDADYRAIVLRVTGIGSAGQADVAGLRALLRAFEGLGWHGGRRRSTRPHVRKVYALWGALQPHLRDGSDAALRRFVLRQTGVASPDWLDGTQANRVTEGLKAWLARAQAAQRAPDAQAAGDAAC